MYASTATPFVLFFVVLLACCSCSLASSEEQQSQPRSRTWLQTAFRTVSGRAGTRGKKDGFDAIAPLQQTPFGRPILGRQIIGADLPDDYFAPGYYEQ